MELIKPRKLGLFTSSFCYLYYMRVGKRDLILITPEVYSIALVIDKNACVAKNLSDVHCQVIRLRDLNKKFLLYQVYNVGRQKSGQINGRVYEEVFNRLPETITNYTHCTVSSTTGLEVCTVSGTSRSSRFPPLNRSFCKPLLRLGLQ